MCRVGRVMYSGVMQEDIAADDNLLMTHHTAAAAGLSLVIERQASYGADSINMTAIDDEAEMLSMPECQPPYEFTVLDPAMAADSRLLTGPSCSTGGTVLFLVKLCPFLAVYIALHPHYFMVAR